MESNVTQLSLRFSLFNKGKNLDPQEGDFFCKRQSSSYIDLTKEVVGYIIRPIIFI